MKQELWDNITPFLDKVFSFTTELGIDVSRLNIDHAALRFRDPNKVDQLSEELKTDSKVIGEAVVNGRKIYIFKLNQPITYGQYLIPCIELPYPAHDHDYPNDGWEHVEFVLPTQDINGLELAFRHYFPSLTEDIMRTYGYKLSIPKVEGEQLLNPTIALTKSKMLSIKFHPNSIEKVVSSKI